jgi:hypothetical protein
MAPLLVLFDKLPHRQITPEGRTVISNWKVAMQMLKDNFLVKIK